MGFVAGDAPKLVGDATTHMSALVGSRAEPKWVQGARTPVLWGQGVEPPMDSRGRASRV